jgi:serine/threonine protein kinase
MRICLGQHVGNYQIRQLIGRRGFAGVYLGEHVYLGTRAALKVLTGPLDERGAGAFQREARLLAGLIHPHIVRVLDFGIQDATPFPVLDHALAARCASAIAKGSSCRLPPPSSTSAKLLRPCSLLTTSTSFTAMSNPRISC